MAVKASGRTRDRDATRARILAAARGLFAEHGYDGVSTGQVLERAGVSRGGLYHHFEGKLDLFRAVWEELEDETVERVASKLAGVTGSFDALVAGSEAYFDLCAEWREFQAISLGDARSVLSWEDWRDGSSPRGLGMAMQLLTAAMDAGEVRRGDPEALGYLLVAAMIEGGTMIARAEDRDDARRRAGAAMRALLDGLRA